MKRISAVIFDCDGVMFDSRQANVNYYNQVLANFGLKPMTEEEVTFVHMHTADESIRHIFKGTSYVEQARAYRMQMDYTPFIKHMIMEPGLKELLKILRPQYGLAVATNRSDTIGEVLESNGLKEFFDIVVSSLDVEMPKPHPEAVYKILDFFSIFPEQCLYVGDSLVDWQTAKAAGVPLIAYQNEDLETPWRIKNLLEIKEILVTLEAEPLPI
ncbi:MAG: HAD family hydrolase [Deltaproteobacteria bacterium]|nr:HAD family hydrolase [Deltaproteobacteria bacterium]